MLKIRLTNNSGFIKEADWGFSWKTLFFSLFVPLVRGDLAWFFIGLFLSICTAGIALLVFPFYYNKIYVKKLLAQGFYPLDELSRMTLVNANLILDKGAIGQETQTAPVPLPPIQPTPLTPVQTEGWVCSHCRTGNDANHQFCHSCGHEREKPKPVCPQCGKERQPGMKFCPYCGIALPDQGDIRRLENRPTSMPSPEVQDSLATSSHPCSAPTVPQSNAPKATPFPMGAIAVIVLGVVFLITVLSKGDVLFSFFKGSPKVTASQENTPAQAASQPLPAVQVPESENFVQVPTTGWISASNVNMRAGHSILAQKITTLSRGQEVRVLGSWISESDQEAILMKGLYVEVNGRTKTLGKGTAVSLVQFDFSGRRYLVSLTDSSGTISGWTSEANVKSLKGSLWYKVSTPSGKTGWVLGEFISIKK